MKKIFDWTLILLGSFLEVFFYAVRFGQEGIEPVLCWVMGLALNILLLHAVHKQGIRFAILAFTLICFSVISTSAGQTFMLLEKGKQETEQKYSGEVKEIDTEIQALTAERDAINKQITGTVETLEDRYTWKNTLAQAEERKNGIENDLKSLRERREKILSGEVQNTGGAELYDFYSGLTGGRVKADWFKLALHTALSIFIALMAPVGVYGLTRNEKKEEAKEEKTADEMTESIWVRFMWRGMRKGITVLPSLDNMKEYCYLAGLYFDEAKHNEYIEKARKLGLVNEKGLCVSYEYARQKMGV